MVRVWCLLVVSAIGATSVGCECWPPGTVPDDAGTDVVPTPDTTNAPPASGDATPDDTLQPPVAGGSPGPTESPCEAIGQPADGIHEQMFRLLNNYRANHGLARLRYSKTLEAAADAHARDMWRRRFFEHTNPDGEGPADRAFRAGFCHRYVGENIAEGNAIPSAADAQRAWQNSPGHNANMLNEPYRLVGMGHYYDPATGYHYWVQDLALPAR